MMVLRLLLIWLCLAPCMAWAEAPGAPSGLKASNAPWDNGTRVQVEFTATDPDPSVGYQVLISGEPSGEFREVAQATIEQSLGTALLTGLTASKPYWIRVVAVSASGEKSAFVETPRDQPVVPTPEWFDGRRAWFAGVAGLICGAVVWYVFAARRGARFTIRKISGLDAIEDAVGRATEMGKACLFVPGVQDINDIQTIAGLTILGRVAEKAAEYDCELDVPTSRSLVMTAARETVAAAFYAAARPDAYNEDRIYYVTDEQFAYVSHLTGLMVREKPAACFYLGAFFAESLILSETGNAVGAIQIAGTAQPAQLPFFVAACDYTLIGEEFFAASAYLSGDPDQLGSLKGQDLGKLIVTALVLIGVTLATLAQIGPSTMRAPVESAQKYLVGSILGDGA